MTETAPPEVGGDAPTFTAPVTDHEGITTRNLDDYLHEAPTVLAFFPAAFSNTCTGELNTFRDQFGPLAEKEATVLGISTDLPWALAEFREAETLPFPLVADNDAAICTAYGVCTRYDRLDIDDVAQRSVFVLDTDGEITYRWLADEPGNEPDYDAVAAAVEDASGE